MSLEIIEDDSVVVIGSSEAPSNDVVEIQQAPNLENQENPTEDPSEDVPFNLNKKTQKQRFKPKHKRPQMDFQGRICLPDYCEVCVKFCCNIKFHNIIEHNDDIDNECDLCYQIFESEELLKKHRGDRKGICYKIMKAKEKLNKDKITAEKKVKSDQKKAQREQEKADNIEKENFLKAEKAKRRMQDMLNRKKAKEELEQKEIKAKAEKREQESIARKERKEAEAKQKEINRIERLEKQAQYKKEREELKQKTVAKKKQSSTGTPAKKKNQSITNFFAKSSNMTTPKISIVAKAALDGNNNVAPAPLTPGLSVDTSKLNLNES